MKIRLFTHSLGLAIGSLAIGAAANAQDFDVSGELGIFATHKATTSTDLFANGSGADPDETGGSAVIKARLRHESLSLNGQFRFDVQDSDTAFTVDEAYAEYAIVGGQGYVFAGRRILSYGQSYGLNPADLFADPLRQNTVYSSTKARNDVEGVDMLGAEWLFDSGASLSALYAPDFDQRGDDTPENFGLLRYTGVAAAGSLDYAISALGGDRPGMGVSGSYGLGDASVLYLDATVRRGRDKQTVTGVVGDQLVVAMPDSEKVAPYVTLGFGHSFANGMTVNAELTHDGAGYSNSEWDQVATAIDTLTPITSALGGQSVGQLNGALNHYTLRQNYGFLRLAQEGVFGSAFNAEVTVLHGIDDGSGTAALRIERDLGETAAAGILISGKYGDDNSEFMLRPTRSAVSIYATLRF